MDLLEVPYDGHTLQFWVLRTNNNSPPISEHLLERGKKKKKRETELEKMVMMSVMDDCWKLSDEKNGSLASLNMMEKKRLANCQPEGWGHKFSFGSSYVGLNRTSDSGYGFFFPHFFVISFFSGPVNSAPLRFHKYRQDRKHTHLVPGELNRRKWIFGAWGSLLT